jgi:hypothetical protein
MLLLQAAGADSARRRRRILPPQCGGANARDPSPTTRRPLSHGLLHHLPLRQDLEQRRGPASAGIPLPSSTSRAHRGSGGRPSSLSCPDAGGPRPNSQHPRRSGRCGPSGAVEARCGGGLLRRAGGLMTSSAARPPRRGS